MNSQQTLKELITQFLMKDLPNHPKMYAEYIADQMESQGTLEDYLDLNNRSPKMQEETITRLGYDPRNKDKLESLLELAITQEIQVKDTSTSWLKARLATRDKTQIRRGIEKLCHGIRWATGGELQTKHLIWFKKAKKALMDNYTKI